MMVVRIVWLVIVVVMLTVVVYVVIVLDLYLRWWV